MEHSFTSVIRENLQRHFGEATEDIFGKSDLLKYINIKTISASRGSKSRSSFANLYAIYVLVEDYLNGGFNKRNDYKKYEGAVFSTLLIRQRELPFGSKLQNHALNHRLNEEFKKYFATSGSVPIVRDVEKNRYWINENLLKITVGSETHNIALVLIDIINEYIGAKQQAFHSFMDACEKLKTVSEDDISTATTFIKELLAPSVDARIFEIASYAILKYFYFGQEVYFGFSLDDLTKENLKLYKTGRTNANDGGIDFVMRPLGRFFQVTETLDMKKYFLDIDKIEKFPISFVIKSSESEEVLREKLRDAAAEQFSIESVVKKYMDSIEEIINVPLLLERFATAVQAGHLKEVVQEIVLQSKVEFNVDEEGGAEEEDAAETV